MTLTMTTMSATNLEYEKVKLSQSIQHDLAPSFACVNGHAQALIVRPSPVAPVGRHDQPHQS